MTSAMLFMAIVPVALAMVLAFSLISGRLSETTRNRVERGMVVAVYPLLILHWLWQAQDRWQGADKLGAGVLLVVAGAFAVQFVISLRSGVLFPRFRNPQA